MLLLLAFRQHRAGYRKVWLYPVPIYPWFQTKKSSGGAYTRQASMREKGLPKPVTAKDARRQPSTRRPTNEKTGASGAAAKPEHRRSNFWVWVERPRLAHTRDRTYDRERDRAAQRERDRAAQREAERQREQRERERERERARARERERERDRTRDRPRDIPTRPRTNVHRSKTDPLRPTTDRTREPLRRPTNELGSRKTVGAVPYTSTRRQT